MVVVENKILALLFLKPHYAENPEVVAETERDLEREGFQILVQGMFQFDEGKAAQFYAHKQEKPWFSTHTRFISSRPVRYWVVTADEEITPQEFYQQARAIVVGLREKFGRKNANTKRRIGANTAHTSDSFEGALRELALFGIQIDGFQ